MTPGLLHRHTVETNVLMALFARTWETGLKPIREMDRQALPSPAKYAHIDLLGLSTKLVNISTQLAEKISVVEALNADPEATGVEKSFSRALADFCTAIRESTDALNTIYVSLRRRIDQALGREAISGNHYSLADYERDLAAFYDCSRRHKEAGALVNDLYSDLGVNDAEREMFRGGQR